MEAIAKAMAPIFYNCIYVFHSMTYEQIPEVYRGELDKYISEKKAEKSAE